MAAQSTNIKACYLSRNKRNIKDGFIFHSDKGIQYAANKITTLFSFNSKITQSMSREGNCWDNVVAESFFETIKHECIYRSKFTSYSQLCQSIQNYIDWYNTERLHSSLGYLTPLEMAIK
jgi:putative transposase